jgi:serine/threonine-protein kinase
MGVVYQAVDASNRPVALKMMLPELAGEEGVRTRFLRESATLITLRHRNIVTTFDAGVHEGVPYLVMELLTGSSLRDRLRLPEPMPLDARLDVVIQLCDGLQFAHERGVVHRDVKPANVWLLSNGGVKLLDFGVARFIGSTFTRAGDVLGSAAYSAPEQLRNAGVDGRADVFAAGVILYELLSGRRPFEGDNVASVMEKILHAAPATIDSVVAGLPREVCAAVETAMEKDLGQRYQEAAEFASDLRLARYAHPAAGGNTGTALRSRAVPPPASTEATIIIPPGTRDASGDPRSGPFRSTESAPRPSAPSTGNGPNAAGGAHPAVAHSRPRPIHPVWREPVARPSAAPGIVPKKDRRLQTPKFVTATQSAVDLWRGPAVQRFRAVAARHAVHGLFAIILIVVAVAAFMRPSSESVSPAYRLDVRSQPAGAKVEIDGTYSGVTTPATFTLPAAPRRVRVSLDGYQPVDVIAPAVSPRQPAVLSLDLVRLLQVSSDPPGAHIVVDGSDTGLLTPARLPLLEPTPKTVELRLDGRRRATTLTRAVLDGGKLHVVLRTVRGQGDGENGSGAPPAGALQPTPRAPAIVTTAGAKAPVAVRVTAAYPFEVSGCGRTSAMSMQHDFEVEAPCALQLRSPRYYLNVTRTIDASSGHIELAAPQLARVQLRSRFEWCTIVLAGHAVGAPPVDVEVAAGTYPVVVQCPERSYSTPALTIEPGRSIRRLDDLFD